MKDRSLPITFRSSLKIYKLVMHTDSKSMSIYGNEYLTLDYERIVEVIIKKIHSIYNMEL